MKIQFTVPGVAVGKGRSRSVRRGNFIGHYTPEKTVNYEGLVSNRAFDAMNGADLFLGAVSVSIEIRVSMPKAASEKKRTEMVMERIFPLKKPDMDNVVKSIFDAMNKVVFWDDSQVVFLNVSKLYGINPCVVVKVEEIELYLEN